MNSLNWIIDYILSLLIDFDEKSSYISWFTFHQQWYTYVNEDVIWIEE